MDGHNNFEEGDNENEGIDMQMIIDVRGRVCQHKQKGGGRMQTNKSRKLQYLNRIRIYTRMIHDNEHIIWKSRVMSKYMKDLYLTRE